MFDFLQKHKENIAVGVGSGLVTAVIVAAIGKLSELPPISVPVWVLGLVMAFPIAVWVMRIRSKSIVNVVGKAFGVERVYVDGKNFINCKFQGAELAYTGRSVFGLERCELSGPHFKAQGPAANTLSQLNLLYQDPSMRPLVDGTIEQLKNIKE